MSPPNIKERKVIDMTDEEIKEKAKKQLAILDKQINVLRAARGLAGLIKASSVKRELHKRAINARKSMDGLEGLIEELEYGRSMCMEILGAKKVPIVIERKLKLIRGGK